LKSAWFSSEKYRVYRAQQIVDPDVFRLTLKEPISGTAGEKFVQQMLVVCDWLEKTLAGFPISKRFKKAIVQLRAAEENLVHLQDNDPKKFLNEIVEYDFWKFFMETGLETLFCMTAWNQKTGEKLLNGTGTRNRVTEPVDGYVGGCGRWGEDGPGLSGISAWGSGSDLGLLFSCTGEL
jgi:hypothetical protein